MTSSASVTRKFGDFLIKSDLQINALQFPDGPSLICLLALGDRAITYRLIRFIIPARRLWEVNMQRGARETRSLNPGSHSLELRSRRF